MNSVLGWKSLAFKPSHPLILGCNVKVTKNVLGFDPPRVKSGI